MTDRTRLTVEQVEVMCAMLTKQGYDGDALRDHALADLRRESAAPDGGLSGEQAVSIAADLVSGSIPTDKDALRAFCVLALRSLERPACRVVDKPYAWVIPGDDTADMNGWIACRISSDGEFTQPVYRHPASPPAAPFGEVDALYEKATPAPWEMYQTARPRHFEIGPSQRCIVAMMTTDNTEDNDFGYDNAKFLQALVNAYPALKAAHAAAATAARNDALEEAWQAVNALIVEGELPGNGCDKTAQRNGYVMAANVIMALKAAR